MQESQILWRNVPGGFVEWSALKNDLSVRLNVNPFKKSCVKFS